MVPSEIMQPCEFSALPQFEVRANFGTDRRAASPSTMTKDPIMLESPKKGLDRRDFMIASIATVGASAVSARNAGPAKAQEAAASTGDATSSAPQGTVYTGDVIQGKKVVSL